MNLSRKSLIGTFALAATLAAPLAFAQSDTSAQSTDAATTEATTQSATDASAQSTTTTDATQSATGTEQETTTSNDASAATTAGDPAKKSWSDVDLDKDGNLSKAEASSVAALGQVFDQADGNADGSLTPDEYKAYLAKSQGDQTQQDQQ